MGDTYLVRHCKHDRNGLTAEGILQAESAMDTLLGRGLGAAALVLSSTAPKALWTAEIIAVGLGVDRVLPSKPFKDAGNNPEIVESLDRLIASSLAEHGYEDAPWGLVIVTHMPLISVVKSHDMYAPTRNGEVVEYDPNSWSNPDYRTQGWPTAAHRGA